MRTAYLTTDDVNRDLAVNLAAACGVGLEPVCPHAAIPDGPFDAVVYDLDYLPAERQQAVLAALSAGGALGPAAVHCYNLKRSQAQVLRAKGVVVTRHLRPVLFARLLRAF